MSLVDVQWVLGHAHITTTEIYLTPNPDQVIQRLLAHHASRDKTAGRPAGPAPGYRPEVLQALFGGSAKQAEVTP